MMMRWRYEVRAVGWVNWGLPCIGVSAITLIGVLGFILNQHNGQLAPTVRFSIARILLFFLEAFLPLVAGIGAATIVTQDPDKELAMSMLHTYAERISTRLLLYLCWTSILAGITQTLLIVADLSITPQRAWAIPLVWLAPLCWAIGAGACSALLFGSRAASTATLALLWLAQVFMSDLFLTREALHPLFLILTNFTIAAGPGHQPPYIPYWLTNRFSLLAMGWGMLGIAGMLLERNQIILASEE